VETPDWVPQLFQAIDAMDTETFTSFLTDDACFRFGNAPAVTGRTNIRDAVDGFFATIKALRHRVLSTWAHPDAVVCQGEVTYTRTDDTDVTIPFVNVLHIANGRISRYLTYIDIAPLHT